ncbi:MAG: F0F1 ATP synthase subunit delta [Candidatus Omnitrophica bacterium]|nr:F0F1 ATP synthase subunit delta [Candidatus Omnitrophota bacterium]
MLIISLVLLQLIIFVALIIMFRKILNKNVVLATRHLEELNTEYSKKDMEVSKRLNEARQKYEEMVAKAQNEAEEEKSKILKEAEAEREKIIKDARSQGEAIIQQADKSRQLLISEIEERIDNEAIHKACELVQLTLPEKFKKAVHLQWTDELVEESLSQAEQLQIPEDINEVKVTSAFPLSELQRKNLQKKVKQFLKRDVELKEESDPRLVAGIVLAVGSLVLDGSLKNKIEERAKSIGNEKSGR